MVYSMVYSIVYSIVYRVVVYSMVVYSMVYSIVYSGLARLASGKGPNREKFNLMTDRRTDRRKVQVLSCAFAAKKKLIHIFRGRQIGLKGGLSR